MLGHSRSYKRKCKMAAVIFFFVIIVSLKCLLGIYRTRSIILSQPIQYLLKFKGSDVCDPPLAYSQGLLRNSRRPPRCTAQGVGSLEE